jgi:AraC-like DNA-binding protein
MNKIIYPGFSPDEVLQTFANTFKVQPKQGNLEMISHAGEVKMQKLLLPGNLNVLLVYYNYKEDLVFENLVHNESSYALWIDVASSAKQVFEIEGKQVVDTSSFQSNAYLMNAIFPYKQHRTKGTQGHALLIEMPDYLINKFKSAYGNDELLGRFYSFQNKGQSLQKLTAIELKVFEGIFYQWNKYKNVLSITKYAYELLEWYFNRLVHLFQENSKQHYTLTTSEAKDLFHINEKMVEQLSERTFKMEALKLNNTESKLNELFLKIHGLSIKEYFRHLKIGKAKNELLQTNKTIAEIAYEYGYANPSNFSATFKEIVGLLPNEFREASNNLSIHN